MSHTPHIYTPRNPSLPTGALPLVPPERGVRDEREDEGEVDADVASVATELGRNRTCEGGLAVEIRLTGIGDCGRGTYQYTKSATSP